MRLLLNWKTVTTALTVAAAVYAVRSRQPYGRFFGIPYDFRMPTLSKIKERLWNPEDERIFTPNVFGAGWSVNAYQLVKRFREDNRQDAGLERSIASDDQPD